MLQRADANVAAYADAAIVEEADDKKNSFAPLTQEAYMHEGSSPLILPAIILSAARLRS